MLHLLTNCDQINQKELRSNFSFILDVKIIFRNVTNIIFQLELTSMHKRSMSYDITAQCSQHYI